MFNLKLELLSKIREQLYNAKSNSESNRERGSDTNIKRKSNQYFFDFNGSFWADELGDYSFGLQSQCSDNSENKK